MPSLKAARRALSLGAVGLALTTTMSGCDTIAAYVPELAFCGQLAPTGDLLRLGEGPALFVDAVRQVALEVGGQSGQIGGGLQGGLDVKQQVLGALGPYRYQGDGAYRREAAADRSFQLEFFYGEGVPGKTAGAPLEADLTRLESYVPDLLNPLGRPGPLFPLVEATGLTSGMLSFRDDALRLEVGSALATSLKGYDLRLALGTKQASPGELVRQIQDRKLAFSLADTRMARPDMGFTLTVKRFDLTYGLDGQAELGGDYLFEVANGPLKYFGAVETSGGVPFASLRCGESPTSEFATISFSEGKADFRIRAENFPITLPGLAPLK